MNRKILKIGRGQSCDIIIQHESVSTLHAWLIASGNQLLLVDCGSTNGTRVHTQGLKKITQTNVTRIDRLSLGAYETSVSELLNQI